MMKRTAVIVCVLTAALFAIASCGGASGDPMARFISHYDNMIKILKDNQGDPEKAQQAVMDYQEQHQAELEKLSEEIEAVLEQDPGKALQYMTQIMEKTEELQQLAGDIPGINW